MLHGNIKLNSASRCHGFVVHDNTAQNIFIYANQMERLEKNMSASSKRNTCNKYNNLGHIIIGNRHVH